MLVFASNHIQAASFDCNKSFTRIEKTICSDPDLSELDNQLELAYKKALNKAYDSALLRFSQAGWLEDERNRCSDIMCIKKSYIARISYLNNYYNSVRYSDLISVTRDYPIHPFCVDRILAADDNQPVDIDTCNAVYAHITPKVTVNKKQELEVYVQPFTGSASVEDYVEYVGWSGYVISKITVFSTPKIQSDTKKIESFLMIYTKSGGMSRRTRIIAVDVKTDATGRRFAEFVGGLFFGDRCNDGHAAIKWEFLQGPVITTSATPFRLLNPDNMFPWRGLMPLPPAHELSELLKKYNIPHPFNNYLPYSKINNGAGDCAGSLVQSFYEREVTGVIIMEDYSEIIFSRKDGELNTCLSSWLDLTIDGKGQRMADDKSYFIPIDGWHSSLESLKKSCPAGKY
jgi:uncharacterized protein YecT (DUF1311 family)